MTFFRLYPLQPPASSLGFSVVGLKSEQKGELGIYVQEIQSRGIAAQDGQLLESDQILAIDGQLLVNNESPSMEGGNMVLNFHPILPYIFPGFPNQPPAGHQYFAEGQRSRSSGCGQKCSGSISHCPGSSASP